MTNNFETIDSLLSGYVAGSLPKPLQVLMASQLELSDEHHTLVNGLESAAGAELEQLEPVEMSGRDSALDAIFASQSEADIVLEEKSACSVLPEALHNFVGFDVDNIPWKTKMPGFKEYELGDIDGCHVSMFWIKPGRTVPMHTHEGMELSLIVQGAFTGDRGRFGRSGVRLRSVCGSWFCSAVSNGGRLTSDGSSYDPKRSKKQSSVMSIDSQTVATPSN